MAKNKAATATQDTPVDTGKNKDVTSEAVSEPSISERLFPDLLPPREEEKKEQPEVKEEESQPPINKEEEPESEKQEPEAQEPTMLDLEKFGDYKIVQTVNGEKKEITLKELNRIDQTDKALTQKGQKIGEERKKLAEERRQLEEMRKNLKEPTASAEVQAQDDSLITNDPLYKKSEERIKHLEAQLQQLAIGVQPTVHQTQRQKVADELKAQGFNDFLEYVPKITSHIATVEDDNMVRYYDTPEGAKALYFQLKAKELQEGVGKPAPTQQKSVTERPRPPVVKIDSGSQPSGSGIDDYKARYEAAKKKAMRTGEWSEVLQMKYEDK